MFWSALNFKPGRFTTRKHLEELDNGENDFVIQPTVRNCGY